MPAAGYAGADLGDGASPRVRVAFQGERGAFSEEALLQCWGSRAEPLPRRSCGEVVQAVESGRAEAGILPLENSLAGTVTASYEALLSGTGVHGVEETVLRVRHCLLGVAGASLDALRSVESHPVALAQCEKFLQRHPHLEVRAGYDTAGAAREVARAGDPTRAAIAGRTAAAVYGLEVLASGIEDRPDNQTRFLVVAPSAAILARGAAARSILVVTTANAPGALLRILQPFAAAGINLSKLESRPTGEPWTYRFIVEFDHEAHSDGAARALDEVRAAAHSFRMIGTFRRAAPAG